MPCELCPVVKFMISANRSKKYLMHCYEKYQQITVTSRKYCTLVISTNYKQLLLIERYRNLYNTEYKSIGLYVPISRVRSKKSNEMDQEN